MNENIALLGPAGEIAAELYKSVGTPYALSLLGALEQGDIGALVGAKVDPAAYDSAYSFSLDYACCNFLRKLEVPGNKARLHEEAWIRCLSTEDHVRKVNEKLVSSPVEGVEGIISIAKRKIGDILGSFSLQEWANSCGWGKGATTTIKARDATLDSKITNYPFAVSLPCRSIATAFLTYAEAWNRSALEPDFIGPKQPGSILSGPMSWLPSAFEIVDFSVFDSVAKDGTKRRGIEIQPTLNLFFQKGIGKMIRRRLKRTGVDLDDQEINKRLASRAQDLGLATVDLSEASDTVARELVRLLLPDDWERWMDRTRLKWIQWKDPQGQTIYHRLEKYSSMGNGFTFELESLVFYALTWAIVRVEGRDLESPIGVYGDDIIMHGSFFPRLEQVFSAVGFRINRSKSYSTGRFYESCGAHYFDGVLVTPPYQKDLCVAFTDSIRCANRLIRWALRVGGSEHVHGTAALPVIHAARVAFQQWGSSRYRAHPLPKQPYWLEGDGGLITFEDFPSDRDGILRLNLIKESPVRVSGLYTEAALLSESLRKDGLEARIETSCTSWDGDKSARLLSRGLTDVINHTNHFPDILAVASYGQVTPRGLSRLSLSTRRIYAADGWVPSNDGAWLTYHILIEMQNKFSKFGDDKIRVRKHAGRSR